MAYFLFKCWKERLFHLKRCDVIRVEAKVPVDFIEITDDNIGLVKKLRGDVYEEQFKAQLQGGDFGYYAYVDGKPVGYGWAKHGSADDYFFDIADSACYLCRFFVYDTMRGNGIYPSIITALIDREDKIETFYIAVEKGNESSERGLKKVGFKFIKEYGFIRGFKHTFNKKILM